MDKIEGHPKLLFLNNLSLFERHEDELIIQCIINELWISLYILNIEDKIIGACSFGSGGQMGQQTFSCIEKGRERTCFKIG